MEKRRGSPFGSTTIEGLSPNRVRKTRFLFLIVLFAVSLYGGLVTVYTLEVKNQKKGEIILRERVSPGEEFLFRYTHSVEKTPVEGIFAVEKGGGLRMVETRFPSHGAGLPLSAEREPSQEGWFVYRGGDRFEELTFLFSSLNHPLLRFRHREMSLSEQDGEEGMLTFSVKADCLVVYLLKKLFPTSRWLL